MQGLNDWQIGMSEVSSPWVANTMPSLVPQAQMGQTWAPSQPVPLQLSQQLPEQGVPAQTQWESASANPPPYWYPSTAGQQQSGAGPGAEDMDEAWDAVEAVRQLLRTSYAKNKWITYCVSSGVRFSSPLEEYDGGFLQRFLVYCESGLAAAHEAPALAPFGLAPAVAEDKQQARQEEVKEEVGGSQPAEPAHDGMTKKYQDAVAKWLEDGFEEGESDGEDDEDDDIDVAIQSFMAGAPAASAKSPPAMLAPVERPVLASETRSSPPAVALAAVVPSGLQRVPAPPQSPPPLPLSQAPAPAGPPGVFMPEQISHMPAGFPLPQAQPPRSSPEAAFPRSIGAAAIPLSAALPQRPSEYGVRPTTGTFARLGGVSAVSAPPTPSMPWSAPQTPSMVVSAPVTPSVSLATAVAGGAAAGGDLKSLVECMRHLFNDGDIPYDVRIIVDDGVVNAHRFFLASRCLFFEAKLQGCASPDPWQPLSELLLQGITVDVLKHILTYIYTDRIDYSLDDCDSLQPQEIEYCVHLCEVADYLGLPGLTKLLTEEVLIPVAETMRELDLVNERQRREERASHAVAALSAAALNSAAARNWTGFFPYGASSPSQDHQHAPPSIVSLDDGNDTESMRGYGDEVNDAKTQKLIASILCSGSSTLMIRNLPRVVKQKRLIKEIDAAGFAGAYDFAYLPSSFGRGVESSGLGYGFVNFEEAEMAAKFVQHWHGSRHFSMTKSDAALTVSVAEHQGKEVNVRAWMRKGVRVRNPDLRPFIKGECPWEAEDLAAQLGENNAALDEDNLRGLAADAANSPHGTATPPWFSQWSPNASHATTATSVVSPGASSAAYGASPQMPPKIPAPLPPGLTPGPLQPGMLGVPPSLVHFGALAHSGALAQFGAMFGGGTDGQGGVPI